MAQHSHSKQTALTTPGYMEELQTAIMQRSFVTKYDLSETEHRMQVSIAGVEQRLQTNINHVQANMNHVQTNLNKVEGRLKTNINEVEGRLQTNINKSEQHLRADIKDLKDELKNEIDMKTQVVRHDLKVWFGSTIGAGITLVTVTMTLSHLLH